MEDKNKKINEQLKTLNETKGPVSKTLLEYNRENISKQNKIIKVLKDGEKTIPEIASLTGLSSKEVLFHVTGLVKYGKVSVITAKTGYMKYKLVEKE
ncbi:MAG: MarR family transcriptional regulator [Elusimicrobiota bacterium]